MSYMELKPTITPIILLFFLLTTPCFSRGLYPRALDVSNVDSGIYDIDYRGPETHSSIPPPNRSGGNIHGESVNVQHKANGSGAGNAGGNMKKIHG
ncbi:uncharacterized protein LOC132285252 isoform X1 [Cornus florida]|uniref:uncharacterized protein LOC132285252 isoform X1 n=1 Tax=Cornus florida TaxID=4283 RepID=UPI00289C5B59|nr:uncharacterized protein LOC132285252 isoform X1 [Cornus florida]